MGLVMDGLVDTFFSFSGWLLFFQVGILINFRSRDEINPFLECLILLLLILTVWATLCTLKKKLREVEKCIDCCTSVPL